ncbi:putative autophagy-related protein atg28 [Phaeomoniella chlamydospora]|uniref:Putative autophagy-related protein atg28 n=1 Tax=Phaeomoniella chlamydospora TaxID=158046 RepID=A0A0G2E6Q0_PHACM|nr:putative autophagy-related protein atg28 [Phaeomoniella chlamydospora]
MYVAQNDLRANTLPVRQPPVRRLTLRQARRGLFKSMREFSVLKKEESKILDNETNRRASALESVRAFASKKSGLEDEISKINFEDQSQKMAELKSSAQEVEAEIHELETTLYELRAKHRHLTSQAKHLENSIAAKLSSYQASLQIVEKDVQRFLRHPPISEPLSFAASHNDDPEIVNGHSADSFYSLNLQRRNLPLAEEQWTEEAIILSRRRESVVREQQAFLQGSEMWSSVIKEIDSFEKYLHDSMKQLQKQHQEPLISDEESPQNLKTDIAHSLIQRMTLTITSLESNFNEASINNWNLLVCCIGAELEAFREGRIILAETLGIDPPLYTNTDNIPDGTEEETNSSVVGNELVSASDSTDESFNPTNQATKSPIEQSRRGLIHNEDDNHSNNEAETENDGRENAEKEPPLSQSLNVDDEQEHSQNEIQHNMTRTFHDEDDDEEDEPGPDFFVSHDDHIG